MTVKPIVKWAGGKSQILHTLDTLLPTELNQLDSFTFIEPFVGGGAMLLYMLGKYDNINKAIINDSNRQLINLYEVVKYNPQGLIELLEDVQDKFNIASNKKDIYLAIRGMYNSKLLSPVQEAAYLVFLNKTCFNGLYRENKKGEFNVPFNQVNKVDLFSKSNILNIHQILQKVEIQCLDFSQILPIDNEKAFVYIDPPYRPLNETSSFTKYVKEDFSDKDQIRLKEYVDKLSEKGHYVMVSNSDCKDRFFEKLYNEYTITKVSAKRSINSKANKRGRISELVITNYKV